VTDGLDPADPAHSWSEVLGQLVMGQDLDDLTTEWVLAEVMEGAATPAQLAGFLVGLRTKGATAAEMTGLVRTMRRFALPLRVHGPVVDTCGTGGDRAGTFNISTLAALVAAAAGARVVKHGNRAASGRCGSADLLEAWGVVIDLPPDQVAACLDAVGIGFCFAPIFHPAMRHVIGVRRELGVPTIFNHLGPLTNPAGALHQTIGVADPQVAQIMAETLARLGTSHALVFHGADGLDELTTTGPSEVWEVRDGKVVKTTFDPADVGITRAELGQLRGGGLEDNLRVADTVLSGAPGAARDIVVLGAAAALRVVGVAADWADGLERASAALDSGAAAELRDRWVAVSKELAAR
jgi:anthranilate phosphoribosyltransferase